MHRRELSWVGSHFNQTAVLHGLQQLNKLSKFAFDVALPVGEVASSASHNRQLKEALVALEETA